VLGRKAIIDRIRTFDADVIGLVEIGERTPGTDPMWEDSFPGYRVEALDGQMLLLTKGDLVATASHKLGDNSRCHVVNIRLHGSPLTVVLVDLASDPLGDHGGSISKLREVTASLADDPIIVMGDFNTPSDSVFLDSMRSQMINAFEAAGNGYSATWPVPMPLIAIDQVWVSRLVDIRNCRLCWSLQSDHRGVVTDIVWQNQKLNRDE
jgi:endonuclease/exonuclease/phosphatase family metal-dependent hydrolase